MAGEILSFLERHLSRGAFSLGQIRVSPDFTLRHVDDESEGLAIFRSPFDAIEIAKYDDDGKYRPLKTAPNLRHGWLLRLAHSAEVLQALDFLYPAAIGTSLAMEQGRGQAVDFRTTLGRQSGMYAVVKKLTDSQCEELIQSTCYAGCIRRILWDISAQKALSPREFESGDLPVYCLEACNLLVAVGRPIAKANPTAA